MQLDINLDMHASMNVDSTIGETPITFGNGLNTSACVVRFTFYYKYYQHV